MSNYWICGIHDQSGRGEFDCYCKFEYIGDEQINEYDKESIALTEWEIQEEIKKYRKKIIKDYNVPIAFLQPKESWERIPKLI